MFFPVLLLLGLVGHIVCPGPGENDVSCFECNADHPFPECLSRQRHCHHDEVCQVNYGGLRPEIRCHKKHDCDREVDHAGRVCQSGGAEVHGSCQVCCEDETCVENTVHIFDSTVLDHMAVKCPRDCPLDDLAACLSRGHNCDDSQFCKVTKDENNNHMHGECKPLREMEHCRHEDADQHCDPHHHHCVIECCETDDCVSAAFGATTTSLWDLLQGDCVDQLSNDQCTSLENSQHVCEDRLALRVCPQTCSLCSMFNTSTVCQDTVLNGGCPALINSEDICNNPLAPYICPVTCNLCDALLDDLIRDAVQANRPTVATTTAAAMTTAMLTTNNMGSLTCADLALQSCNVLSSFCPALPCPGVCDACNPTTTAAVTQTSTEASTTSDGPVVLSCSDMASKDCTELSTLCFDLYCPDVCDPCFFNPVTGTVAIDVSTTAATVAASNLPASSALPSVGVSSTTVGVSTTTVGVSTTTSDVPVVQSTQGAGPLCEDTMQTMNCGDVADVCSSALLVSVCQKSCGRCLS